MHLSFTGSYVFQKENPFSPNYTNENRVYLQSTYRHTVKLLKLKYRVRFYNRFVHNRTSGKTLYTHRLRYLIGMEIPIKSKKNNLYFTAYEEVFLIPLKMPELFMEKTGLCRHRD